MSVIKVMLQDEAQLSVTFRLIGSRADWWIKDENLRAPPRITNLQLQDRRQPQEDGGEKVAGHFRPPSWLYSFKLHLVIFKCN